MANAFDVFGQVAALQVDSDADPGIVERSHPADGWAREGNYFDEPDPHRDDRGIGHAEVRIGSRPGAARRKGSGPRARAVA